MPQLRRKQDRHDESSSLSLFAAPPRAEQHEVSDEFVFSRPTLLHAINFAQEISGLEDKQISGELGIDLGQWSRIKSGNAHFPTNKYIAFMRLVSNDIPLKWLAHAMGYELKPLESDLERENVRLRQELAQAIHDREVEREYARQMLERR